MVLDLFGKGGGSVNALLQRRNYDKAILQLRVELEKRKKDERLRLQLADLLAQSGRKKEAIELLNQLSDDLAWDGFAAKAIAVLKKIEKLDPGRSEVEEKLAYLINQKTRPSNDPWAAAAKPPAETEEIGLDLGASRSAASTTPMAATPQPSETLDVEFENAAPEPAAIEPAPAPEVVGAGVTDELVGQEEMRDELLSLIENVFVTAPAAPPSAPAGDGSPMVDTPLFRSMSPAELVAVIRKMRLLMYEPGEIIVAEGQPGDSLFIITTGRVRAYVRDAKGAPKEVRQLGEGDFFGEISVLEGGTRTATVTSASDCELLEFDKSSLDEIAATHPRVKDVMREFAAKRRTGK